MTGPVRVARLSAALWECDRHQAALIEALDEWRQAPAPDIEALERNSALRRLTDQIIYRFTKLQDAMGERLVPATLAWLREPHEDWSMRDRLDRLERLGFLDVDAWLQWRDVRNRLAHEYPDQAALRFAALLAAMESARGMVQLYGRWKLRLPS
jgi:hypothetical protein